MRKVHDEEAAEAAGRKQRFQAAADIEFVLRNSSIFQAAVSP